MKTVLKMKILAKSLIAAGQHITDDKLVLYILGGLGSEYDSVIVNLTSKEFVTLQEAQYMLQTHEMRLESLHSSIAIDISHSAAHFA